MRRAPRSGGSHGAITRTSWPRSKSDSVSASTWRLTPPGYVHEYGLTIAMRIEVILDRPGKCSLSADVPETPVSGYRTGWPPKPRNMAFFLRCPGDACERRAEHRNDHQKQRSGVVRERPGARRFERADKPRPQHVTRTEPRPDRAPRGESGDDQRDDDPKDRRARVAGEAVG